VGLHEPASTDRRDRVATLAGVLAPVVTLGAILFATLRSPTFSWTEDPLSLLGEAGQPTRYLFNYGLVVGGLLSLGFAARLVASGRNRLERAGGAAFALTGVAMALVGVFPTGTAPHFPAAVAFYLLLSVSTGLYGAGNYRAGDRALGGLTVGLGALNLLTWAVYVAVFAPTGLSLALPEVVGAVALGGWTTGTALRLW
jgi:hypothetical membrane protein